MEIRGEQPELSWVLVAAFRYAVRRHGTQCLLNIQSTLIQNFDLLNDEFLKQMISDIDFERNCYTLKSMDVPAEVALKEISYLDFFYDKVKEELKRRENERAIPIHS